MKNRDNIVLLGMPGAGKSTIGVLLAKSLGKKFLDTDLLIQEKEGRLLREIIKKDGLEGFLSIENRINAAVEASDTVIAPGGSVIYGKEAMEHLAQTAVVVYLKLSYETVRARLGDLTKRGVARRPGQTLYDLYEERCPLYERYADLVVECDGQELGETLQSVMENLKNALQTKRNDL